MDAAEEGRFDAVDVVAKRDEGVSITFGDGFTAEFNLMELRLGCPCAECRSRRDRGEEGWPLPHSPLPLALTDAAFHGGWGLSITWNDGHSTGIFPFDALRRWAENGAWRPS